RAPPALIHVQRAADPNTWTQSRGTKAAREATGSALGTSAASEQSRDPARPCFVRTSTSRRGSESVPISSRDSVSWVLSFGVVSHEQRFAQLGPVGRLRGLAAGVLDLLHEDDDPAAMCCDHQQRGV